MAQVTGFRYSMKTERRKVALLECGAEIVKTNRRNFHVVQIGQAQLLISYNSLVAIKAAGSNTVYANGDYTRDKTDKKGRSLGWRWCSTTTRGHVYELDGGYCAERIDGEQFEDMVNTLNHRIERVYNVTGRM